LSKYSCSVILKLSKLPRGGPLGLNNKVRKV